MFILLFVKILPATPTWFFIILFLGWAVAWIYLFKEKALKIWFFLSMILLLTFTWGILHVNPVQNFLIAVVTKTLSKNLQTKVSIKHINLSFFNKMSLEELMIEDRKKDTLLFAGNAKVNIIDWFFLKDKIVINNLALDNAVINMHRKDSVWNYQFLVDYFSPKTPKNKDKKGVEIDIKEVHLTNIKFNKIDEWIGQNMVVTLQKMDLTMDKMDMNKKQLFIKEIYLEKPLFWQSDYDGNKPIVTDLTTILAKIPVISAFKWNQSGWVIKLNKLQVFDGSFRNEKFTKREMYADKFDGQHILFSSINGSFSEVVFLNDTLTAALSLSAKERSGLTFKKLESNLKFTPEFMEFKKLDLQTDKSRLGNYFSMRFNSFNKDMSSFINNVTLDADFTESVLSSDDLAIFAPNLASMKRVFYLQGKAKGTIDNFTARNLKIRTGNSFIDADISMRGLPQINSTFIDLKSRLLQTNYNELAAIVPSLKKVTTPALNKMGNIKYTGTFTGFIKDFVAYGNISTSLGSVTADLNMKLPDEGQPYYSGKLATNGFELGQFLNDKNLGNISLNGNIKGSGFSLNKLNANFNGSISKLYYAGYTYQNATVNGNFKNKIFNGTLSINDPNLKIKKLEGELNLSGKELAFNANADLDYVNLTRLGFIKDNLTLSGYFNLNFTGNNIDNFLGSARVYDAILQHDSTRLSFDSLTLNSYIINQQKTLEIESNELYAKLQGKFKIMELPDAFSIFLNKYYPTYIRLPKKKVSEQDFNFEVKTKKIDEYIRLFDNKLNGFNGSTVKGSINLARYELTADAFVPEFSYDGKIFTNTNLVSTGNRDTLFADISSEDIKISDSLHFPASKLKLTAHNDVSLIKLNTSAGKTLNDAELNASIQTLSDGVRIHFFPSSFVINTKKWLLEKDGELTLRKNYLDASEVKFVNNQQEIVLSTELDELTDGIHLLAKLKNVVIEDFLPFFVTSPSLKGRLTGVARISDPTGKQKIEFDGVADSFSLDNKYIGKVNIIGRVNTITGLIDYKINSQETDYAFTLDGFYNYMDSTGNRMNNDFKTERINLNILEPYLGNIFSQINGVARGNLTVSGNTAKDITIIGDITIDTGRIKVAFTQCRYSIINEAIHFGKNEIDLGTIRLTDTLNNTGTASGKMYHNFFRNFSFENIRVETGKMLVLNTAKKDNSRFYGTVIGSALMTMNGPTTDLRMNIDGQPSVFDSSHIYLNTGETSRENTKIDYLEFIQFGSEMDKPGKNNQASNILVNMNITANPACKVDVILDEETGDIIKGQGSGQLNIRVGNVEPLSIRGRYVLSKGEYTFNFQTFLRKPFTLSKGTITWNGDPLLAIIDIDAEYLAKNVDISNLTTASGFRQKQDIVIISHLSGNLATPVIDFEFQLPDNSSLKNDYFTVKKLEDFKNDKNSMFKQVASLLLLNQFISENQIITGGSTVAIATSTIGGVVSSWLTNIFNRELERATKGIISTYIDINPTVDLQSQANQLQANVRAGLKIFLSSRINLLVAGNYDYNNPYVQAERKGLFTPDITLEWLLNKDGSLRVVGFNRTSIDFTSNQRKRSGVQLSYRKDFNKVSDIFKSRKKILVEDSIQVSR